MAVEEAWIGEMLAKREVDEEIVMDGVLDGGLGEEVEGNGIVKV